MVDFTFNLPFVLKPRLCLFKTHQVYYIHFYRQLQLGSSVVAGGSGGNCPPAEAFLEGAEGEGVYKGAPEH